MIEKLTLKFCGGVGEVTGANFLLEQEGEGRTDRILIDCGLSQGSRFSEEKNHEPFPYNPADIKVLLVTHAHIDHIGRIPKLVKDGFKGKIISTGETKELSAIMLLDAQKIMEEEARREGILPLYDDGDLERALGLWEGVSYGISREIVPGIFVIARDAGHILGSAMYEVATTKGKILFTGDLGNSPSPLLRDTEKIEGVDYIVMESVYGDRNHEDRDDRRQHLASIINRAVKKGGALLIPIFSLEKTQVILNEINYLVEHGEIPEIPVYLDSPLAIKVTEVYKRSTYLFNEEAKKAISEGDDIFRFPKLRFTPTRMESQAIYNSKNPKIIIAGSGMSTGGRIIGHEKIYLGDSKNTILFVGYQAAGSLGRQIEEGVKRVDIDDVDIDIRAEVAVIKGYSSHKGCDDLVSFIENTASTLKKVFVVMGEPKSSLFLVQRLRDYLGVDAIHPEEEETIDLL